MYYNGEGIIQNHQLAAYYHQLAAYYHQLAAYYYQLAADQCYSREINYNLLTKLKFTKIKYKILNSQPFYSCLLNILYLDELL